MESRHSWVKAKAGCLGSTHWYKSYVALEEQRWRSRAWHVSHTRTGFGEAGRGNSLSEQALQKISPQFLQWCCGGRTEREIRTAVKPFTGVSWQSNLLWKYTVKYCLLNHFIKSSTFLCNVRRMERVKHTRDMVYGSDLSPGNGELLLTKFAVCGIFVL